MSLFKPIAVFSTIAGLALFQLATAQYTITLPYKQVSVENRNGKAVFNGAPLTGEPGKPDLPGYVVSFLLPPEVDLKDVTVKLIDPVYEELNETFDVDPPVLLKDPVWPDSTKIVDGKDTSVYRKNTFYPVSFKGLTHCDQLWQYKVASVTIYPFRYNPVQKKLRKLTGGILEASFKINAKAAKTLTRKRMDRAENELRGIVANPEILETYGSASGAAFQALALKAVSITATKYAIITTDAIYNACKTKIDEYVTHLQTDDSYTNVRIVTDGATQGPATWVAASDVEDRALNIRAWLTAYVTTDDWNVLLIGNPSPIDGDVPMATMDPGKEAWGTDYFYGDLTATWGDPDAALEEVPVGRIPVYSTSDYTRLNDFLQKTIDYKRATDIEWRRFALIPIVPLFGIDDGDFDVGDLSVKAKLDPSGWECRRLYEPYSFTDYFKGIQPKVANAEPVVEVPHSDYGVVLNNWNSYAPGLVVWHTHGYSFGAAGIIYTGMIPSLNNNYQAIVFSASCHTSYAQEPHNLGVELIYRNAIAYVGGTHDLIGSQLHDILPGFVENIRDNESVGNAVKAIHNYPGHKSNNKRVALYGCPEVSINLPNTPQVVPGPRNLTATWISNSQIDLTWSAVPDAQIYTIERALQVPNRKRPEGWSTLDQVIGAPPACTYSDVSTVADKVYLYRIRATTSTSVSGYSQVDSVSTFSQALLPQTPSNLQVSADCYSAIISWDPPATVQPGTSYNIKRRHVNKDTPPSPCAFGTVENTFQARDVSFQEAEDAALSGGASFNNNHNNYSGAGFIEGFNSSITASVEFAMNVAVTGAYQVNLQYSAGAGTSTNMGLYLNGVKIKDITCPGTANWDAWATQTEILTLNSGVNTIKYKAETASTNYINLDRLYIKAINSYIDKNLVNGEEYEYTVSTVNDYGESPDCPAVSVTPEMRALLTPAPIFDRIDNVSCNYFEFWWHNQFDNARLYTQVEYYYDLDIAGTLKRVSGTRPFHREAIMDAFADLENNLEVFFRFRAFNESDDNASSWSDWYSGRTDNGTPPGVPRNFTVTSLTPSKARLTFLPGAGPATDGYELYHKYSTTLNPPNPDPFSRVQEIDGAVTSIDVDVTQGEIDSFTIRAFNTSSCGKSYSDYSTKIYISNSYWPVNSPYPLSALCASPNEIDLEWSDNAGGEVGYCIERSVNKGIWQPLVNLPANTTGYQDNSVTINNVYDYRVRATCPSSWWPGYSDWVLVSASTKSLENISKVYLLPAQSTSPSSINVQWYLSSNEWRDVLEYTVFMSSDHGPTAPDPLTYSPIATQPGNVFSHTVTSLAPGVNYWFGVSATTWAGTGDMDVQTDPVQTVPASPTNLTAIAVSGSQVNLTWNDNSTNESGFNLEYTVDPPDWGKQHDIISLTDNSTSFSTASLQPNQKYWFRVNASNNWGSSGYSNVVTATTPADPCISTFNTGNGLSGTIIGAAPSSAGDQEYCKATDGNTSTFYTFSQANGGFTGLKFKSPRTIQRIRFCPRNGYASRMVGGKFQGSNTADFNGATDLYTITSTPTADWNVVTISRSLPYEYVRYLGPNGSYCNIAEMEFYELPVTYTIKASDVAGAITPNGDIPVNSHANQTFTITPPPRFKLDDVLVDNISKGPLTTYTFNNVIEEHSISATLSPQTKYEAENASLNNGAGINTNHTGYSGTGFVDGFWRNANAQVTFSIQTKALAFYMIKLRYSAGNGTCNSIGLYVNDVKIKNLTCPGTGNWDTWATISETVELDAGLSTIQYKSESSSSYPVNLDYIEIIDVSPRTIIASAGSNGSISPSDNVEVPYGGSQIFTILPNPYYEVSNVMVDGVGCGPLSSYTFSNITQNHTIEAEFELRSRYEAENAILSGTANINTNHAGYSGTGFADGFWNSANANVLFDVYFTTSGSYAIKLRYSAGNGISTKVGLYVDGVKIKNITCPGTINWDTWAEVSEIIQLTYGAHQIEYRSEVATGNPINLDYLCYDYLGQFVYEAEDAWPQGTAHINSVHSGYSGTGFVDGYLESTTATTTFNINVAYTGTYEVRLRYSAGNGTSTNVGLYLNKVKIKTITCPGTSDWNSWAEVSEDLTFIASSGYRFTGNELEYKVEASSNNCINLDKITLTPISIQPTSNLKVYTLDQTIGSNQQTQPRFYIENEGTTTVSNFTMKYYFSVESGKTPVIENYYMTTYTGTLQHISGNNWCVVVNFPVTLAGGGRIPSSDGFSFGLHYSDWANVWNQSNDFSQPTGSSYSLNNKVALFNSSGQLIYGSQP